MNDQRFGRIKLAMAAVLLCGVTLITYAPSTIQSSPTSFSPQNALSARVADPAVPTAIPLVPGSGASASSDVSPLLLNFGTLAHSIVYDNGSEIILLPPGGSPIGLAFLSPSPFPFKKPRFSGYVFVYYNNGFFLGDIYGHHTALVPPLGPGETVYDAWPSPDGRTVAWQFVTSGAVQNVRLTMGSSRIVLTDARGGNATTLLQQGVSASGAIPIIYGWRMRAQPTLLVQNSFGSVSQLGMHTGLEEFDPNLGDMVGDFLPPLGDTTDSTGEVLGLSTSGQTLVYATANAFLPSGEGPFPTNILAMTIRGRHIQSIDKSGTHHDRATSRWPVPRTSIFYRGAYVSPDDTRVAYTRLNIVYPQGSLIPIASPIACLANLDGTGLVDFGPDARVLGWIDTQTLLVRKENTRENGLYTVNAATYHSTRLVLGNNLQVAGIVP